jgi:hypothetical protein
MKQNTAHKKHEMKRVTPNSCAKTRKESNLQLCPVTSRPAARCEAQLASMIAGKGRATDQANSSQAGAPSNTIFKFFSLTHLEVIQLVCGRDDLLGSLIFLDGSSLCFQQQLLGCDLNRSRSSIFDLQKQRKRVLVQALCGPAAPREDVRTACRASCRDCKELWPQLQHNIAI